MELNTRSIQSLRRRWVTVPRTLVLPLVLALPPLFWVIDATRRASLTTLGRDQGIFQYVAWALQRGAVDYRDVRDVNGPLTHLIHLVLLHFGGGDEHRFRTIDLTVTGLSFAFVGACLPGILRKKVTWLERLVWAFAAWVVLSGQYLMYLYWDLAQRESFFDWFMLSGVALQFVAQRKLVGRRDGDVPWRQTLSRAWPLMLAAALGAIPWFGKPTYVLFTGVQLAALLLDSEMSLSIKRRLGVFALGALAGAATQVAFLAAYGDIGAFARIYLVDVPAMYRFMLPRTTAEILSLQWAGTTGVLVLVTAVVHLGLIVERQLPARTISFALVPVAGLVSALAQAKGFPYHFHPVTAGLHLEWVLFTVWLWEKFTPASSLRRARRPVHFAAGAPRFGRARTRTRGVLRLIPYAAATLLATKLAIVLPTSPHLTDLWILGKARNERERSGQDYLVYFRDRDFFPWEMRQVASYLRAHTQPTDRVQIYGMDSYVLFLAQRMSATPYIYVYDLNVDSALGGSWMPDGLRPNPRQADVIAQMRAAHERDMLEKLQREPPAAFVFFDKSPLISNESAVTDFNEHCPESAAWVRQHYRETASFGEDHVWMRNDVAERIASAQPQSTPN